MSSAVGERLQELDINVMPFSINYNGPAPISKYMRVDTDKNGSLTSHFRGREMKGECIPLPETIHGVLVSKPKASDTTLHILGSFREVKLWEHDISPSTSIVTDVFDWVDISMAVCALNVLRTTGVLILFPQANKI